jgi:hypothetical protein
MRQLFCLALLVPLLPSRVIQPSSLGFLVNIPRTAD